MFRVSIVAIVENDTIRLPPGVHLPDGTTVRVEPQGNSLAWLGALAGTVEGPEDLADFLSRYIPMDGGGRLARRMIYIAVDEKKLRRR